jgi:hypothetical protein
MFRAGNMESSGRVVRGSAFVSIASHQKFIVSQLEHLKTPAFRPHSVFVVSCKVLAISSINRLVVVMDTRYFL